MGYRIQELIPSQDKIGNYKQSCTQGKEPVSLQESRKHHCHNQHNINAYSYLYYTCRHLWHNNNESKAPNHHSTGHGIADGAFPIGYVFRSSHKIAQISHMSQTEEENTKPSAIDMPMCLKSSKAIKPRKATG